MIVYQIATYDHEAQQSSFEPISRDEDAARAQVARRAAFIAKACDLTPWPDPELYRQNRSVASISLADADGEYVLTYSVRPAERHCPTCSCD